jgi:hypothetical protein
MMGVGPRKGSSKVSWVVSPPLMNVAPLSRVSCGRWAQGLRLEAADHCLNGNPHSRSSGTLSRRAEVVRCVPAFIRYIRLGS